MLFHLKTRTLVVSDTIENLGHSPENDNDGNLNFMLGSWGMKQRPALPADLKICIASKSRHLYKKSVMRTLDWDFIRIIPSHGRIVDCDARDVWLCTHSFVL